MKTFEYSGFFRIKSKRSRSISLVLWKDIRSWETFFELVSSEVFLTWYLDLGPASGTDTDNPPGTDAFEDEICLEPNLYSTASQWGFAIEPCDLKDWSSTGHVARADSPVCVLQGVLDRIHHGGNTLLEIRVEGIIYATEEGCGNGGSAKFTILDLIDPTGHPAAADECLMGLGLIAGGPLDRDIVQPDIGDMKAGKDTVRCGPPGNAEKDRLIIE